MPSTFPGNPQNGDAHANNGKKYIYDGNRGVWVGRGRVDTIDPGESDVTQFTAQSIIPSEAGTDLGSPEQRFGELYLSGNSIFLGDKVLRESNVIDINTSVQPETLEIQVDATGAGHAPDWLWTWEQTTLPFARLSITNSTQISVPLYQQSTYVINNYSNSLHGDMTQIHSFKLKWIEGAGDDNLVDWVTYTTADDSHPDIDEGNTHTVQRLSFTIPASIELPTLVAPNVTYTVTNDSAGAYTFSGTQLGNNPQLGPFYRGGTYTINIDATGHPFYFTTDNGTGFVAGSYVGEYTTGVTGSRTESGTITFTVPQDAPDTLYYQCGNHAVMRGVIPVRDLAVEQNSNGNYIIYGQHSQDGHAQRIEIRPLPELASQMCLVYDAASDTWQPQDLATYVENTPSFENKIKEVAGTATLVAPDGTSLVASVEIYSIESYLPLVDNTRGDIAFAQDTNKLYIWDGTQWITAVADGAASGTGGSSVTMSDTSPAEPSSGDMWYDTTEMNLFVYYVDDTSSQWVQVATNAADVSESSSSGTTTYADMAELVAATGMSDGDMAFVLATNNLYIYKTNGWFKIATVENLQPGSISGVDTSYSLATDGTPTVITATATDPEGFPLTWSYAVTAGSLGSSATVSQADNVFTITPSTNNADEGEFSITFSVTDGVNGAVNAVSAFSLVFDLATGGDDVTDVNIGGTLYRVHTFTSDGTFEILEDITNVEYLIVGGGGAGSRGGGGAGGLRSSVTGYSSGGNSSAESKMNLTPGNYPVVVGSGGVGADPANGQGQNGGNSSFNGITALGGGGGGKATVDNEPNAYGGSGGSGGGTGSGYNMGTYDAYNGGTSGQGFRGGAARGGATYPSGGGGGAGGVGQDGWNSNTFTSADVRSGDGGVGLVNGITGTDTYYAGGGGGSAHPTRGNPPNDVGTGGNGGGGNGQDPIGSNGTDGLGGGGGAGGGGGTGGSGGSGVVIIRYPI